jgi:pimeloyl-ACP methyl ester carboxylesterase
MVGRFSAEAPPGAKGVFRVSERTAIPRVGHGDDRQPRRIAYRAEAPTRGDMSLFWLSGLKSDMASTKATELALFAAERGYGCTRFDYSGHGLSSGPFEEGTIGAWLEEAEAVFSRVSKGRQIVVGSSLGGYIALLLLRRLMQRAPEEAARLAGLVLIAPAWDMTEELMWKQFPLDARRQLENAGVYLQPSEYGEPYAITRGLIEEGRQHLFAGKPIRPGARSSSCRAPRPAVPIGHARKLAGSCRRASAAQGPRRRAQAFRPQDLGLLFTKIDELAESTSHKDWREGSTAGEVRERLNVRFRQASFGHETRRHLVTIAACAMAMCAAGRGRQPDSQTVAPQQVQQTLRRPEGETTDRRG